MTQLNSIGKVHTVVFQSNGKTNVQYHQTIVVSFNDKEIILRSDGYHTVTTKVRMNQTSNQFGLGFQVWQKNHVWFVDYRGETIEFSDGMKLER